MASWDLWGVGVGRVGSRMTHLPSNSTIKERLRTLYEWRNQNHESKKWHSCLHGPFTILRCALSAQTWTNVNGRTTQAACTTVSTSLAITGVPAMTDSTWHTTDTTVWVSERGLAGGRSCTQPVSSKREESGQKESKDRFPSEAGQGG